MISFERWFLPPEHGLPELTKLEAAYALTALAMLLDERITSDERKVQMDFLKAHGINRRDHMDLDERVREVHRLGGGRLMFHAAETTLGDPIDRYRGLGLIIRVLHASGDASANEGEFLRALYSRWLIPDEQTIVLTQHVDQLPRTWFHTLFHFIGTQSRTDADLLEQALVAIAERDLRKNEELPADTEMTAAQRLVSKRPTTILSSVRNSLQDRNLPVPTPERIEKLLTGFYDPRQARSIGDCVSLFLSLHRFKTVAQ